MAIQKGTLSNRTPLWNSKKRYKVNESVIYEGSTYQNSTGFNSEPGTGVDWVVINNGNVYIPLAGTEAGSPVTGDIYIKDAVSIIPEPSGGGYYLGNLNNGYVQIPPSGLIQLNADANPAFKGLQGNADYSANYDDFTYVQKAYVDSKAKTGTAITFTSSDVYGTFTTPETTNITVDLTNARIGLVQKMYHQSGTAPTFPAGFVKISGNYSLVGKNIIYFEFCEGTRVEYWIINL